MRVFCGFGGGGSSLGGACCVLCFLDPVTVLYVHSVRAWKMVRSGGASVWNWGPGVFWTPLRISRSLATIPRVILGGANVVCLGGLGGTWGGVVDRDAQIWASSPSDTTSFSATHVFLCSGVMRVDIS